MTLGHDEFDRVEVPRAGEAASEVYTVIGGGAETATHGASKVQARSARLRRNPQVGDHVEDGNVVSQGLQVVDWNGAHSVVLFF